jgi:hypothetical protein
MEMEVQYSRDSCLSLRKNNPVFRIMKKRAKGEKIQDFSPEEFGENLKILITKKLSAMNNNVSIETFVSTMEAM